MNSDLRILWLIRTRTVKIHGSRASHKNVWRGLVGKEFGLSCAALWNLLNGRRLFDVCFAHMEENAAAAEDLFVAVACLRVKFAELGPAVGTFFCARPAAFVSIPPFIQDNAATWAPAHASSSSQAAAQECQPGTASECRSLSMSQISGLRTFKRPNFWQELHISQKSSEQRRGIVFPPDERQG
jgi:hypothetical protein